MNLGIHDALALGVPKEYVDAVLRKFIPEGLPTIRTEDGEIQSTRNAAHKPKRLASGAVPSTSDPPR